MNSMINCGGKMKRKLKILLIISLCLFLSFWGISILRCEVLTIQHGNEFENGYMQTNMISEPDYLKVLNYSNISARVYYVNKYSGNVISFIKKDSSWHMTEWDTIWSKFGSADDFIWPYIR